MAANPFEIQRKIARLNDLIERAQHHLAIAVGRSPHCVMGNAHEHARWARVKLNEPELSNQDDAGATLLPSWPRLTQDLYSALRRTGTVLFDEDQIAPDVRGNRKLIAPIVSGDEWPRIHDMTVGDDNMTVIAALKIQDGWITELKRQKEEAEQRRQEQQQRAQERKEQKEQEEQEEDEDDEEEDEDAGTVEAGQGDDGEEPADGMEGDEEGAQGDAGAGGNESGLREEPGGDSGEVGDLDGDGSGCAEGEGAPGGPGTDAPGLAGDAGPPDPPYTGEPEPNNAVEAAEAGAAYASAAQAAALALEDAQKLAEALAAGGDVEEALAAAEAALEAAEGLCEATDDAEERVLAQEAFDEQNGTPAGDSLKRAVKLAAQDLKDQTDTLRAWGIGKGDLKEMDPTEIMELFKLLRSSEELKKIADLIGYQKREVQKRKVRDRYAHGPEVRVGVEQGRKLHKMLGSQRLQAVLAPNVFRYRYFNNQLMQHKTRIEEVQERGDGSLWIDGSGSMWGGSPYTYTQIARATAITVVDYFQSEGRNCTVGIFDDGVREVISVPAGMSKVELLRAKIKIATQGYGGGTDFYAPLLAGLTGIRDGVGFWDKSSLVMITDGQCYMSESEVQEIKRLQEETKVDIQAWLMPGASAEQLKQFGPVDNIQTSLDEAGKMALKVVERMDAQWQ